MFPYLVRGLHQIASTGAKAVRCGIAATLLAATSLMVLTPNSASALAGNFGIHDPSSVIYLNGTYHIWGTGNQISHLTSTDLVNWTTSSTVFASGTWPSWINTYVSTFAGDFWAPECVYMGGKYYLYYACSMGARPCAIGVATSTDLTNWTDQGMVTYSGTTGNIGSIDPAIFTTGSKWYMTYGSHLGGIYITEINPSTGKLATSTITNIAGNGTSSQHEASYVIPHGGYYYLFFNRGVCCAGTSSTYYVSVGRSTSPTGPYTDKSGASLLSNGGTTFVAGSTHYYGPGQIGLYGDYLTYHYYDGNNNGAPTLAVSKLIWSSGGWPVNSVDPIANGTYKVTNYGNGLAWDDWGATGVAGQAIAQNTYSGINAQRWTFTSVGNGEYKVTCLQGGLSAEVLNCNAANGGLMDIYTDWSGSCQRWKIARHAAGGYVFFSLNGNRVIDVPNGVTTTGTQLDIWDYLGGTPQRWNVATP